MHIISEEHTLRRPFTTGEKNGESSLFAIIFRQQSCRLPTAINWLQRATVLYKPVPTAVKYFFLQSQTKRRKYLKLVTVHAANNGWDVVFRRVLPYEVQAILVQNKYFEALQLCTHVVKAQHLGKSDYCVQSRRAVKSDSTLPESNTVRRITRANARVFKDANYFRI